MARRWRLIAILTAVALVFVVRMLFFSGTTDLAHESIKYELHAIGQSIYEYHNMTGRWPSTADDLERTSLSLRQHYWQATIQNGSVVIVWNDHLSADPAENRNVVLAYHNKGTLAMTGYQWVCWGDLRTEYLSSKRLRAVLANAP
jgi:hypothetical protein